MDITPQDTTTQPMSDDQELAKALAGVLPDEPEAPAPIPAPTSAGLAFEETAPAAPAFTPAFVTPAPAAAPVDPPFVAPTPYVAPVAPAPNLEDIKKDALGQLRPLIDHVELPPEEKFDTYLMLIRSTDDPTLIAPAHVAAQGIQDEKRRAEALLDIIKEIDFLSRKDQPLV